MKETLHQYEEATDLLKRAQAFRNKYELGVTEAVWEPNPEYPNLPICISLMTDIHYGSLGTDYDLLDKHLKIVEDTPNFYMVSNGDNVDAFNTVMFPTGMFENPLSPQQQSHALIGRLRDLDADGKVGVLSFGNHDNFVNVAGYDWLNMMARDMNAAIFTSGGFLHILVGKEHYGIAMTHTFWGKSKLNPTNTTRRFLEFEYPQADIAFLGHTHQSELLSFDWGGKERIACIGGTYKIRDDWMRHVGLGTHGGKPGNCVLLYPDTHRMIAIRDIEEAQHFMLSMILNET